MWQPHTASDHVPIRSVFIITAQLWLTHSGKRLNMVRLLMLHIMWFWRPTDTLAPVHPSYSDNHWAHRANPPGATDFKILLPQRPPASRSRSQQAPSAALTAPRRIDERSAAVDDNVESENSSSRIFFYPFILPPLLLSFSPWRWW